MFIKYTGNRQFDLQLNRVFNPLLNREGMDAVSTDLLPRIKSTQDITRLALQSAQHFDKVDDADAAWRLYELAAFYLPRNDPHKQELIDSMSHRFDRAYADQGFTRHKIPYGGGELTAMRWQADSMDRKTVGANSPRTLIMMNGFDGYAEEIMSFAMHFPTRPFDIIVFDGPGQGHTALAGMPLEPQWERPTAAVLDFFGIESAAALGVSFGGYLVMRAAAYTPRISHVIAFDMMYRLLDGLTMPLPRALRPAIDGFIDRSEPEWLINTSMRVLPHMNADLAWKLQQARDLTGLRVPTDVLTAMGAFTMAPLEGMINQHCLVMAGDADQYVPFERLEDVRRALRNAASLDIREFHAADDPDMAEHCQLGDIDRAFEIMGDWLTHTHEMRTSAKSPA